MPRSTDPHVERALRHLHDGHVTLAIEALETAPRLVPASEYDALADIVRWSHKYGAAIDLRELAVDFDGAAIELITKLLPPINASAADLFHTRNDRQENA